MNTIEKRIKDDILEKGYLQDDNLVIHQSVTFEDLDNFINSMDTNKNNIVIQPKMFYFEKEFKNKQISFDEYLNSNDNIYDYLKSKYTEQELGQLVYQTDSMNSNQKKWIDENLKVFIKNEYFDICKHDVELDYPNYVIPKHIIDKNVVGYLDIMDATKKGDLIVIKGKDLFSNILEKIEDKKSLKTLINNAYNFNNIITKTTDDNIELISKSNNDINFRFDNELKKHGLLNENGDFIQILYNFPINKDIATDIFNENIKEDILTKNVENDIFNKSKDGNVEKETKEYIKNNIINIYEKELVGTTNQIKKELFNVIKKSDFFDYSTLVEFVKKNIDSNPKTLVKEDLQDKVCDYLVNNKKIAVTIDKKTLDGTVIDKIYDDAKTKYFDKIIEKIKSLDVPNKIFTSDFKGIFDNMAKILRDKNIIDENNVQHIVGKDLENGKFVVDETMVNIYNLEDNLNEFNQDDFKEYLVNAINENEDFTYNYNVVYSQIKKDKNALLSFEEFDKAFSNEDKFSLKNLYLEYNYSCDCDYLTTITKKNIRENFVEMICDLSKEKNMKLEELYNNLSKNDVSNYQKGINLTDDYDIMILWDNLDLKLEFNLTKDDIDLSEIDVEEFKQENIEEKKQEEKQEEATKKTKKILKI